jgi:hypothetical protein
MIVSTSTRPRSESESAEAAAAVAFPVAVRPFPAFLPPFHFWSQIRRAGFYLGHARSRQVRSDHGGGWAGQLGGWDLHHAGELELGGGSRRAEVGSLFDFHIDHLK